MFISLLGATSAWALSLYAQSTPRVGILLNGRAVLPGDLEVVRELARLGRIEGHNVLYEVHAAEGSSFQLPKLALDLVATKPDVIIGSAAPAAAVSHVAAIREG